MHHYRPDIDGLRAVAIVPVVLFHAGVPQFSGGFVGVDVFFVISGYLITRLLRQEIDAGTYSLAGFYERRIRRLFPALFAMLLATTAVAAWLLLPTDLADFGKSVLATSLFASNFLFWQESGYFGRAAEEIPLLHTWSLAVEEQFYIVWPLVIFLTPFQHLKKLFWGAVIVAPLFRLGVLLFYWNTSFAILGDPTEAAYALPVSHMDAFALGALLTLVPKIPHARPQFFILLFLVPALGMLSDYLTVGQWNGKNSFGWELLLPNAYKSVWGYSLLNYWFMLLIYGVAREGWFVRFLDLPWLRYLGRISYGLYVYHYAVWWIFTQIYFPQLGLVAGAAGSLALTILIGAVSYHAFEWPIDSLKDRWFPFERKSSHLETVQPK